MRSSQSFVVALLAGAVGLVPMNVIAQGNGFLILSKPTPDKPSISVVQCQEIQPKQEKVTCDIIYKGKDDPIPCKPGACSFHKKAARDVPGDLTYGVSYVNPTCAWVYHGGLYYPVCW